MYNALLVTLILIVCNFINYWFGYTFTTQPIIVAPLVGLVLGDMQAGIICGATYELIFLGAVNIGGIVPSDATSGAAIGTSFTILTGMTADTSLALAIPAGLLCGQFMMLIFTLRSFFNPSIDKLVEKADAKGIDIMAFAQTIIFCILVSLPTFFAVSFGASAVEAVVNSLPAVITEGLTVASGLLAAVGFGLLLKVIWSKKLAVFFFVGYFLAAYLEVPIMGVAMAGILYCIIDFSVSGRNKLSTAVNNSSEEDLFDE